MAILLDTNAVLRYLLNDIEDQALAAKIIIDTGAEVTPEVIAECVYVLTKIYEFSRARVSDGLSVFLDDVYVERRAILQAAFKIYKPSKFDFIDCILLATNALTRQQVFTFDKKLASKLI